MSTLRERAYVHHVRSGAGGSPRRASDPLEQELHVVMSYHVGARDQIRVLYQS